MPKDEAESRTSGRRSAAVSDRAITWSLIVLLLAGALSIPISQTISQTAPQPQPVSAATSIVKRPENAGVPREIRYRIDPPDKKSPNEFRLTFDADSPGNAYVFSESLDDQGRPVFDVLYPLAKLNAGTAHIEPNQTVNYAARNSRRSAKPTDDLAGVDRRTPGGPRGRTPLSRRRRRLRPRCRRSRKSKAFP